MGNKPPKICFVEALAYPVLSGDKRQSSTGGESVQHTFLARAFAELGWQVSMISRDVGQEDGTVVDGVQVWKTYVQKAGLPYIRFVHPRLTSIWRALKQADADIYFQSCAGLMTGAVARFAASRGRQMIFRAAHDTDFMPGEELINYDRDRHFYRYGLKRAGLISVQSEVQQQLLSDNYGLPSVVVDMAAEIPSSVPDEARDIDVLWVNNFRQFKRPEIVLDIASFRTPLVIGAAGKTIAFTSCVLVALVASSITEAALVLTARAQSRAVVVESARIIPALACLLAHRLRATDRERGRYP